MIPSFRSPTFLFLLLCIGSTVSAQEFDWPAIIFKDSTNFNAVKIFGHPLPREYRLLKKTAAWSPYRLSVKEDITNPEVRKRLENAEHHLYQWYIFRNTTLDTLVPMAERNYLLKESQELTTVPVPPNPLYYQLIDSAKAVSKGFYFSLTSPIFSINHEFAYIDMNVFLRQQLEPGEQYDENFDFYAGVLLVYRHSKEKGWTKFLQIDHPIL